MAGRPEATGIGSLADGPGFPSGWGTPDLKPSQNGRGEAYSPKASSGISIAASQKASIEFIRPIVTGSIALMK
jgi:hypothetical protein